MASAPPIQPTTRNSRRRRPRPSLLSTIVTLSSIASTTAITTPDWDSGDPDRPSTDEVDPSIDYGNHNLNWDDGPASWEEFGHDNDPSICGLPRLTVQEWEEGQYWKGSQPVIVTGVTEGWAALNNWKLSEMLERYPDAEATMGDGRRVGEIGPDAAGKLLTPTTVKEFITKHMYDPFKYFFDRKIAIPNGMLEDCHPFPMPTRQFLDDPLANSISAPSHKAKVDPRDEGVVWRDHLAIAIGSDLQGLSFHHHGSAWNTVIFGKKRWIMYDPKRWQDDEYPERQRRVALASPEEWEEIYTTPEWIRKLYPDPFRQYEIKNHGYDCIQHAGEMMYVPRQWMHMVVNIGDTVSVVSEVGLDKGEGKSPDEFLYDPFEDSSDDSEDESEDNEGGQEDPELVAMLDEMAKSDRDQAEALYSDIKGERKYRSTLDPEKWQEFSYWDIFAYFGCTRINSRPPPLYSASRWADIRQFWKDFVKFDANHRPKEYAVDHEATYQFSMEPFEPPVEAFQNNKGRGVRATRDIAKGELVFKGTNNTIVFAQGDTYRRFLFAVYERYGEEAHQVDSETACDVLSWHWVQSLDEDEDGNVAIVGDLDNGSLMNEGRADEEGWDSPNVRCGKEEDGGNTKCMMEYYATEDIKKGDELLSDFRTEVDNPWSRMGL